MKIGFNIVSEVGNEINYVRDAVAKKHISGAGIYTKSVMKFLRKNFQ